MEVMDNWLLAIGFENRRILENLYVLVQETDHHSRFLMGAMRLFEDELTVRSATDMEPVLLLDVWEHSFCFKLSFRNT